jgi:hypothetical protein
MMDITITLGWWMAPAIVTVAGFVWMLVWNSGEEFSGGMFDWACRPLLSAPAWLISSLTAWLIWSLLS